MTSDIGQRIGDLPIPEIEDRAQSGSIECVLYIADALRLGTAYAMDLDKAGLWYARAAEAGSAHGLYGLGLIARTKGQFSEAMQSFRASAERGHAPSFNAIAIMNWNGEGVAQDKLEAEKNWKTGIRLGSFWAVRNLARKYMSGKFGLLLIPYGLYLSVYGIVLSAANAAQGRDADWFS